MNKLVEAYNKLHKRVEGAFCELIANELKAQPGVTEVRVENLSADGHIKGQVAFRYRGALVCAWFDKHSFTNSNVATTSTSFWRVVANVDLTIDGQRTSVVDLIASLHPKYQAYLKRRVEKLEASDLPENLTRKQRAFMLQQLFLEEGYNADLRLLSNGEIRIIVGHPEIKTTIKEIACN